MSIIRQVKVNLQRLIEFYLKLIFLLPYSNHHLKLTVVSSHHVKSINCGCYTFLSKLIVGWRLARGGNFICRFTYMNKLPNSEWRQVCWTEFTYHIVPDMLPNTTYILLEVIGPPCFTQALWRHSQHGSTITSLWKAVPLWNKIFQH